MGRHSTVVSLICTTCTITVVVLFLSFICCVSVFPRCIYTGIASAFIYASFSANMRATMPCFTGITISRLISALCLIIYRCYTLCYLSPKAVHTSCILIGLQQPPEKYFPPIYTPKELLKQSSCVPKITINGPCLYIEYMGWPNIVDALGLMNLPTMDPLAFHQASYILVANNVSKLSIINVYGEGFLFNFIFTVPWENIFWCGLNPWPCCYCYVLGLQVFLWYWGL